MCCFSLSRVCTGMGSICERGISDLFGMKMKIHTARLFCLPRCALRLFAAPVLRTFGERKCKGLVHALASHQNFMIKNISVFHEWLWYFYSNRFLSL